jgi:hypothetical protein
VIRSVLLSALATACLGSVAAQDLEKKDAPNRPAQPFPTPLVRLANQASKPPVSALAYRLQPDPVDVVDGNAGPLWLRAGREARAVRFKWTEKEWQWVSRDATPLDKLPRKDVAAVLAKHFIALQLADLAALRKHCDWGFLPLTVQNLPLLPLSDIQSTREMANLLNLRCRLALAEGKFEEARRALSTGLTLARHIGQGDSCIQDLVGIAIASVMFGRIEEWLQTPGSPNLYWPLTTLPRPFIDARRSMRFEMGTIYRSFPRLRGFREKKVSADEARAVVFELLAATSKIADDVPGWKNEKSPTALAKTYYPIAKKALIAAGRPAKEVEAMPQMQAVALYLLDDYDRIRDDINKWLAVPPWQGQDGLDRVEKEYRKKAKKEGNVLIAMLLPALKKVYHAQLRLDRQIAGLRGAEALRQYAATHAGKVPAKWADLGDLPRPIDPFTGKGLDAYYKVEPGKAILDIPPPPEMPALLGRRYELTVRVQ